MGIIIKPIVTEKQTAITEKFPNRYGFRVSPDANKLEIKKAVEEMYGVTVESVNTMNYAGKKKSRYSKTGVLRGRANEVWNHQWQDICFQEGDCDVERRRNN